MTRARGMTTPQIFDPTKLHPILQHALAFFQAFPLVGTLIVLMVIDICCGVILSFIGKRLSSSASWRGMFRKILVLMMLGVAAAIEPFAQGIPLSRLVAMFYIVTESISILENAAAAGVPLPRALVESLVKLREGKQTDAAARSLPMGQHLDVNLKVEPQSTVVLSSSETKKG